MDIYSGDFSSWADVVSNFGEGQPGFSWGSSVKSIAGAPAQEPDEVIHASYDNEDYEGSALVVYRNGNRFFKVEGSHCSCYGLEGQWTPEEYDLPTFIAALERPNRLGQRESEVLSALKAKQAAAYQG